MIMRMIAIASLLGILGCQSSGVIPVSQRHVAGLEKVATDTMVGLRRNPETDSKPLEIYVRRSEVRIDRVDEPNTTGSLYNLDDPRNYLFVATPPLNVGQFLDVNVASHRLGLNNDAPKNKPAEDAPEPLLTEGEEAEILASLPHLGAAEGQNVLLKSLRFKVDSVLANGDVIASLQRRSVRDHLGNAVDVRVRVPANRFKPNGSISTNDLVDVNWFESLDGQVTERYSSAWEDEYTARLSGFEEAMSEQALELARKERQLQQARQRMESRLQAMGAERNSLAREREELNQLRAASESQVQELQNKVREQDQELQRIRPPDEKPGDERDGAAGR